MSFITCCFVSIILLPDLVSTVAMAGETTVTGRVNAYFQIEGKNGELYDIEMTPIGDEMSRLVGAVVRATGTVQKAQGKKIIVVTTYQVIGSNIGEEATGGGSPSGENPMGEGLLQGKE